MNGSQSDWMNFAAEAWRIVGHPAALDPEIIRTNPLDYDRACLKWLESHFKRVFALVREIVHPYHMSLHQDRQWFSTNWKQFYRGVPLWRQLVPFVAWGSALKNDEAVLAESCVAYALVVGVSGTAVDQATDLSTPQATALVDSLTFAIMALLAGVERITNSSRLLRLLPLYTRQIAEMLELQASENRSRYVLPEHVDRASLEAYCAGPSRLGVAIFFRLAVESAFLNAGLVADPSVTAWGEHMSRARQLTDEIVDVCDDVRCGLTTFPVLHALAASSNVDRLKVALAAVCSPAKANNLAGTEGCRQILSLLTLSNSLAAAGEKAWSYLLEAGLIIVAQFEPAEAFPLTLLMNQRFAHLERLRRRNWEELPIAEIPQPIGLL